MELNSKSLRYYNYGIALLCIIAFFPVFKAGFVNYDDPEYVLNNSYIKHFSWENIKSIFAGKATILYVPLTVFSYMLEYSMFGQSAKVFHTVNLLLHIVNALLLFWILRRLNIQDTYLIGLILAFFALNPLVTESVCWITERKDVLYCFFFFLSILQFLNYYETKKAKALLLCFVWFVLACFSKPMAVSLPVLILIFMAYKSRKAELKKWLFLLPFFLVSFIFSVVSIRFISTNAPGKIPVTDYDLVQKLVLVVSELGYYFMKPFMPVKQQLIQLFPPQADFYNTTPLLVFAIAGLLVAGFIAYQVLAKKQFLLGILFLSWVIFLLPVLQIYPNTNSYVSERYFYVSIIFPIIIIYQYLQRLKIPAVNFQWTLYLILPVFAILTFQRSRVWAGSKTLFEQELKMDGRDPFALNNLGYYYNELGQFDKGYKLLQQAVQIDSSNALCLNNYGWALAGLGRTDSAIIYFNKAIVKKRRFANALNNLGVCYMQKNLNEKALVCFSQAYAFEPNNHEVLYNLGAYYLKTGQVDKARPLIRKAYAFGNKSAARYLNY